MAVQGIVDAHQARQIEINQTATDRTLKLWGRMDFANLDASWLAIQPKVSQQIQAAQLAAARTSDGYTSALSAAYGFEPAANRIVPEAFVGVDGTGRSATSLMHGAVTTTKEAVGAGLSRIQSFEAGATFLAAMMKTALADVARASDTTSSVGKGYTVYARVVEPGACSRCVILAGTTQFKPFKRHPACRCTVQPVPSDDGTFARDHSPADSFNRMSEAQQNRAFTNAGAQSIRDGADISSVLSARRGSNGISWSTRGYTPTPNSGRRMQLTTIGKRADGSPVRVYTTAEGTTRRGNFGQQNAGLGVDDVRLNGSRYSSTKRVRLMPESIVSISDDLETRQILLRDAGYMQARGNTGAEILAQQRADRAAANEIYRSAGLPIG